MKNINKYKNQTGFKTNPRCLICNKEMFPDVLRFRGMCSKCNRLHRLIADNLRCSELILQMIYQEKGRENE